MTREEIEAEIFRIFRDGFEIDHPDPEDNLREKHHFDSIDAIELLVAIERYLGSELSQAEKKKAMDIRSLRQIFDYVEALARSRQIFSEG
jgi:acyl carrier protein